MHPSCRRCLTTLIYMSWLLYMCPGHVLVCLHLTLCPRPHTALVHMSCIPVPDHASQPHSCIINASWSSSMHPIPSSTCLRHICIPSHLSPCPHPCTGAHISCPGHASSMPCQQHTPTCMPPTICTHLCTHTPAHIIQTVVQASFTHCSHVVHMSFKCLDHHSRILAIEHASQLSHMHHCPRTHVWPLIHVSWLLSMCPVCSSQHLALPWTCSLILQAHPVALTYHLVQPEIYCPVQPETFHPVWPGTYHLILVICFISSLSELVPVDVG